MVEEKVTKIEEVVILVLGRVKDLRLLFQKQKLALKKFQKEAGEDWRNSKYVYAISSVQSMIYQIQTIVRRLLEVNNSLLGIGSSLHSTQDMFVEGKLVDSFSQKNWVTLKEPTELPTALADNSRLIKQRSEKWFEQRNQFKVTGSKIYEAIGLDTVMKMVKHFDKVVRNVGTDE